MKHGTRKKPAPVLQNFKGNTECKKGLVKRIEELTGQKAAYTFVPRCAYLFEHCAVEKDGSLSIEKGMDLDVVRTLLTECLITGELAVPGEGPRETTDQKRKKLLEENGDREITVEEAMEPLGLIKPDIALPMSGQSQRSIRNLLNLIYSMGALISKATRGNFSVPAGLVYALGLKDDFDDVGGLLDFINAYLDEGGEVIKGLELAPDRITFTGYPATDDRDVVYAYMQLTAVMVRQCAAQRFVLARVAAPAEGNEKYLFRNWLMRMGMKGPDFKETRDYLLFPLEGDAAFCTRESVAKRRRKLDEGKKAGQDGEQQKGRIKGTA